ncbi:2OG-Fe(II) oxygenase family protein [Nocardia australiensis]|uniref:2OG-Fe(II) oxygenase family protein n=1 Tax=Nocardia australiensis TaxID=2887191 RepID=UPI001D140660|nr:2OG-Fe(II) oxygenase family protein [Nocardia australiensis]
MLTGESVRDAAPQWFVELFAHRRWIRRTDPFPHVYARDVFVPEFYRRLAEEFGRVRTQRPEAFTPVSEKYSATGVRLSALRDGPLALFLSREWHDLIAGVAGVTATGDVEGSLHHHAADSPQGWPHNDLAPAWFGGTTPGPAEVRTADPAVDLKTGTRAGSVTARETVRAVAVLFYLGNPDWKPGDGGETALYENTAGNNPAPSLTIPPLDNSMVLFECTPRSWHTYVGNNAAARNCVVMWLHRPKDEVVQRWGGDKIEQW